MFKLDVSNQHSPFLSRRVQLFVVPSLLIDPQDKVPGNCSVSKASHYPEVYLQKCEPFDADFSSF